MKSSESPIDATVFANSFGLFFSKNAICEHLVQETRFVNSFPEKFFLKFEQTVFEV